KPHFDINAAVVKQLGEELVSDEITALIELVKNAYDADANYASVVVDTNNVLDNESLYFSEVNGFVPTRGYVIVEDDGIGMESNEIENGWLTISFSYKRKMRAEGRLTPKKRRTPLGDKGLGRLSTQRLGHRLEMFTCKDRAASWESQEQGKVAGDGSKIEHHVAFDWSDFTEDMRLSAVPVHWSSETKEKPRRGTKLVITDLLRPEVWLGEAQRKLVGQLSQLIFPFEEVRPFNVYLTINGTRFDLETIAESLRDIAVSRFSFSFDEHDDKKLRIHGKIRLTRLKGIGQEREELYDQLVGQDQGQEFYAYLTNPENRLSLPKARYIGEGGWFISYEDVLDLSSMGELALDSGEFANPGKFHGEIDEFFFRGVNLESLEDVFSKAADYRDFVRQHVGVRVYRDGFGIRPYGLNGSDWLNLGGAQTSGLSYYPPRPQNVIGYVALTAKDNLELKEKTDREGFVDTLYSRNFFRILGNFVDILGVFFNNLGRSYNEYRKQYVEKSPLFISPDRFIPEVREITSVALSVQHQVERLDSGLDQVTGSIQGIVDRTKHTPLLASEEERELSPILVDAHRKLDEARNLVQELRSLLQKLQRLEPTADSLEARIKILEDQLTQFSELAGLGLTAEALSHEIHSVADRLARQTKDLSNSLRKRGIVNADLVGYTEYVNSAISTLRKQLSHLAPSLRYVRERKDRIDVRKFFSELEEFYSSGRFKRSGIQILLEKPFDAFSILINKGKLTQVADNIVLNSEYWLREAMRRGDITEPKVMIRSKRPFVAIYDNGIGIDPSIETSLFQPFVTTKPKDVGRGLGLFIVRELLDSSGCSISLLPDRNRFGRKYIFQMDLTGVMDE
nr:sensor histidine kinase [Chloroflexota bacterium]